MPRRDPVAPLLVREPTGFKRIAIVGEAPGVDEAIRGKPFVGASGKLLRAVASQIGLDLDETFITNVCCCRPPQNRTPLPPEIEIAKPRLFAELQSFKPSHVISLGNTAAYALMGAEYQKITNFRGVWQERNGMKIMPTYHPAMLLRQPEAFKDFVRDLKQLVDPCKEIRPPVLHILDTGDPAKLSFINKALWSGTEAQNQLIWSIDIETTGFDFHEDRILSIAISPDTMTTIIVSDEALKHRNVLHWLQTLAKNKRIQWSGHNAIGFDAPFIEAQYGISFFITYDTMLMHYAVDERAGKQGLKIIGRDYFGLDDWSKGLGEYLKGEGATYENIPRPELYRYQAMDTVVTVGACHEILKQMPEEGRALELYETHLRPAARVLSEIEQNGALIDVNELKKVEDQWTEELLEMRANIETLTHRPGLNPRSTKQLKQVLFEDMGLPKIEKDSRGTKEGTGKKAIAKWLKTNISEDDKSILKGIQEYRSLALNRSTYAIGLQKKRDEDGRIRTRLLLHGTETGRLASADPNLQNIPKHRGPAIRNAFVATPGWTFVEADYSQLEFRVAAWYSQDPGLIAAFESGYDFHQAVAAEVLGIPIDKVTKEDRFQAKFVNFGIMYGRGAKSLCEDGPFKTIQAAQEFIDRFLAKFPRLAAWFEEKRREARELAYVESHFGRRRRYELIVPYNSLAVEREAVNAPIQSMASDICVKALSVIHDYFDHNKLRILFPVHDSILMEIRNEYVKKFVPEIREIMQADYVERRVPFTTETDGGYRWGSLEPIDEFLASMA